MSGKKRKIIYILLILSAILFFGCVCLTVFLDFYIPHYLEKNLLPGLVRDNQFGVFKGEARRVGLFGADFGSISLSGDKDKFLKVQSVRVDFNPYDLLFKRSVSKLIISGVELELEYTDSGLKLKDFDLDKWLEAYSQTSGKETETASPSQDLPMRIGIIEVRRSVIKLEYRGKTYLVPYHLAFIPQEGNLKVVDYRLEIYPRGQKIELSGSLDLNDKKVNLNLESEFLELSRFDDLQEMFLGKMSCDGELKLNASAEVKLEPFEVGSAKVECRAKNFSFDTEMGITVNAKDRFFYLQGSSSRWKLGWDKLLINSFLPIECAGNFDISLSKDSSKIKSSGNVDFSVSQKSIQEKLPFDLKIDNLGFKIALAGSANTQKQSWEISAKKAVIPRKITLALPDNKNLNISFADSLSFNASGDAKNPSNSKLDFAVNKLAVAYDKTEASIPEIKVTAQVDKNLAVHGEFAFNGGEIKNPDFEAELKGISMKLPFDLPFNEKNNLGGSFKIGKMGVKGFDLGSLAVDLDLQKQGILFKGINHNKILDNLKFEFNGNCGWDNSWKFAWRVPEYKVEDQINLGKWLPAADGTSVDGAFSLEGKASGKGAKDIGGNLSLALKDINVSIESSKIKVEGVNLALKIPEITRVRSAPEQKFSVKKLSMAEIVCEDLNMDFQIESSKKFFIEKCGFKWCGGSVYTHAMRITEGRDDYRIILFCNQVIFRKVLEQFGIGNAKGEGALNGRIPVEINKGKIVFDNGFLYSTPGEPGYIRLTGTEMLTSGIPKESQAYVNLEFTREALEDFKYNWVKIFLNSEKDELLMQLQFYGKPTKPLHFSMNKEGFLQKVDSTQKFQAIRLDVNSRSSINEILRYGKGIKGFFDKLKN
jgi:hypothetical protein